MATANEVVKLPSGGVFEGIPKEVTIRNMTTAEEKMLLGSSDDAFDAIIQKCIVAPEDLKFEDLISADKHFLLMKLRIISYGPVYPVKFKCPYCGHTSEFDVNLDEQEVDYLPEDFVEPYDKFTLPDSKDSISLRIPRIKDLTSLKAKVKRYNKNFPEAIGDISYIFGLMLNIKDINGKELPPWTQLQQYVENLSAKDSSYIRNRISKLKVGLDTAVLKTCPRCKEDLEFQLTIGPEFFHSRLGE